MLRCLFVASLAAMIVLAGCKVSTKPRTLMTASPGQEPRMRRVAFDGEYRLYAATTTRRHRIGPDGAALATERLRRGERVGFRRAGGALTAVAAGESVPLEPGRAYLWQVRADPGQVDRTKTVVLMLAVGLGVTVALFAAADFSISAPAGFW